MQRIMSSWVGSDINQVIERWGFPNEEKVINGRKIYIWNNSSEISATKWNCTRTLEVDQNNTVKSWEWQGNNCPYVEWGQYKSWSKK